MLFLEVVVEEPIVVPGYNDLVFVWLIRQPCELRLYFGKCAPLTDIAGVKKKVTRRDRWSCAVCVGDAYHCEKVGGQGRGVWGAMEGFECRGSGA